MSCVSLNFSRTKNWIFFTNRFLFSRTVFWIDNIKNRRIPLKNRHKMKTVTFWLRSCFHMCNFCFFFTHRNRIFTEGIFSKCSRALCFFHGYYLFKIFHGKVWFWPLVWFMHTKKFLVWFTLGRICWEVTKCMKMVTKLGTIWNPFKSELDQKKVHQKM